MTAFHAAFEAAMNGDIEALRPHLSPDDRAADAMSVYRNTSAKGRIDALEANFPTVVQMVGPDWFRAAAGAFIAEQPGDSPVLAGFGAGFPDWLGRFPPAADMPYLAPCARLDRAWTEAHLAADAAPLTTAQAAGLGPVLAGRVTPLHPSARLFWFDWTAPDLWLAHRYPDEADPATDLSWRAEALGLLVHRPDQVVTARRLTRDEWVFLDACRRGRPLGAAVMAACAAPEAASALFARMLALGVLTLSEKAPA